MLAFVVFAEMMGYKAEFAYIHAVKLAQRGSLAEKKMGKEKIFVIGLKVLIGIHLSNCMIIVHVLELMNPFFCSYFQVIWCVSNC